MVRSGGMRDEGGVWLERFVDPRPISGEGAFRITAARDGESGAPVTVVTLKPETDRTRGAEALEAFFAAHRCAVHPVVARAVEHGRDPRGAPFVVLACPARLDLSHLLSLSRRTGGKVSHGAADGFISTLRMGMVAAAEHAEVGSLGTLGYPNVLFAPDGRFWLVGFGHNVAIADENGRVGGPTTIFQAPEVAVGAPPTLSSDYVALILLMRSLVPFTRLAPTVLRIVAGRTLREDLELITKIRWFDREVIGAQADVRASVQEALAVSARIRELLGVTMDPDAFREQVREALEAAGAEVPRAKSDLRVGPGGAWIEAPGGARTAIASRHLARLALALAEHRVHHPGEPLAMGALLAAGWPGEKMAPRAGANRIYVAVSQLRKLAFGRDLESHEGGYRLSPAARVTLAGEPAPASPGR
jgi:hypothetical protein